MVTWGCLLAASRANAQVGEERRLFEMFRAGTARQIFLWLEAGGDPNRSMEGGTTPLSLAVRANNINGVRVLLEHGARPDTVLDRNYTEGETVLLIAVRAHRVEIVRDLLAAGANPHGVPGSKGFNPLMEAVNMIKTDEREAAHAVVGLLLERGADPNGSGKSRPMARAVEYNDTDPALVNLMVRYGGDKRLIDGAVNLTRAAAAGNLATVRELTEIGISGHRGLVAAAGAGRIEVVRYLLSKDVPVQSTDEEGINPLMAAAYRSHWTVLDELRAHTPDDWPLRQKDRRGFTVDDATVIGRLGLGSTIVAIEAPLLRGTFLLYLARTGRERAMRGLAVSVIGLPGPFPPDSYEAAAVRKDRDALVAQALQSQRAAGSTEAAGSEQLRIALSAAQNALKARGAAQAPLRALLVKMFREYEEPDLARLLEQ
jgi:ankyrin repeat protein